METVISGRYFEWDDEKARTNFKKHGVTFKTAAKVFDDPYRFLLPDEEHSQNEERWKVTRLVKKILFVVCTDRSTEEQEKIRLISAREATPKEKEKYYGNRNLLLTEERAVDTRGGSRD